jgi:hypothetical protein
LREEAEKDDKKITEGVGLIRGGRKDADGTYFVKLILLEKD